MNSLPIVQGFLTQWFITQGYEPNRNTPGGPGKGGTIYTYVPMQGSQEETSGVES